MDKIKGFFAKIGEYIKRYIAAFKMNGEVKKRTYLIGAIALVVILAIILLCMLLPGNNKEVEQEEPPVEQEDVQEDLPRVEPDPVEEPKEMAEILEKYDDAYAWIVIPGTAEALSISEDTSLPVAQNPDDRLYYLDLDLDGNKSAAGTLYTEKDCEGKPMNNKDFTDPVTIIYGHNMANRTMFGGMQTYLTKMDWSKEPIVYIYQKDRRITYRIVGGVQYETTHVLYYHETFTLGGQDYLKANGLSEADLEAAKKDDWNNFFNALLAETDSSTNIDKANWVEYGDNVLILSVCKNGDAAHRYLIICKMVEDTADPTTWAVDEKALEKQNAENKTAETKKTSK